MSFARLLPASFALLALLVAGGGDRACVTWWQLGRPAPLPAGQTALRLGVDASYPPFAAVATDGTLWGLEVDLSHAVAAQLGLPLVLRNVDAGSGLDALPASEYDAILGGIVYDPTLGKVARFSPPYFAAGPVLLSRSSTVLPMAPRIAVEVGAPWPGVIGRLLHQGAAVQQVWDDQDGMAHVEDGDADAFLVDRPTALEQQRDRPSDHLQMVDEDPDDAYSYRMAEGRADRYLAFAIDHAIRVLDENGSLDALQTHWFETRHGD